MKIEQFSQALGQINDKYLTEIISFPRKGNRSWKRWGALAACLCLVTAAAVIMRPGKTVCPPFVQDEPTAATTTPQPLAPPDDPKFVIHWDNVAVNELDGLATDAARWYYDEELYTEEKWTQAEIQDYYGWELNVPYIPDGLTGGGNAVTATVWRDKSTGEVVEDQVGRGFWSDFYEDGSPKSDDDIVIPKGFTIVVSRLGILHCALLLPDEAETTDFGGVPVTLSHASLPYGPFDPTQKDPSGLYNKPAGYYDVYVASFTMDGVEYEIETHRLEREELVKITASVIGWRTGATIEVGTKR